MPGANYFLSQVAAQTPGPLLGNIVTPKLSPPPCVDLVSSHRIQPFISVIGTKSNICRDVATTPPRDVSVFNNGVPKQQYNHSLTVTRTPPPSHPQISFPPTPPLPPGLGSTNLPIVRKTTQENPVGELQELCTKMRWVFPSYSVYCDESQPHERAFSVIVRLYRFREKGEAKSKRAAKREAARRILARLSSWPTDQSLPLSGQAALPAAPPSTGIEMMPSQVKTETKSPLASQSPPATFYINELTTLTKQHGFAAVYIKVEGRTLQGEIQCLLQLTTWPIVIVTGAGKTTITCKADAARKALDSLRILCKSYFVRQNEM